MLLERKIFFVLMSSLLFSCNESKSRFQEKLSFDDTLKYRGKYLGPVNKHDSVLNVVKVQQYVDVYFMLGFNNTQIKIDENQHLDSSVLKLTTNNIIGLAKEIKVLKRNKNFNLSIGNETHKIALYEKYLNIYISLDTLSRELEIEYTNSIPTFY